MVGIKRSVSKSILPDTLLSVNFLIEFKNPQCKRLRRINLKTNLEKILIAAVTPSFLEKEASWFTQNFNEIEKSRREHEWYRRNTEIFEAGQKIKLSEFLRRVAELGYTKAWETQNRGEFSQRGGVIHIFPINYDEVLTIEFEGNYLAEITLPAGRQAPAPLTLRGENNEVIYKNPDKFSPLKIRGQRSGGLDW